MKKRRIENHINPLTIKNQEKETERLLLYETPPNLQFSFKIDNTELLEEISKISDTFKIKNQEIKNHVSTSNHNKEILKKLQEESETEVDTKSDINKLQSQFKNLDLNKIILGNENDSGIIPRNNYKGKYVTHTSIICNRYPKPKPPDIQLRELVIRNTYALYNWYINGYRDGLLEYEILNVLYKIITANVYKDTNRSNHQVSNPSVGNLSAYRKNIYENLKHLKYLTSTDFKWYKRMSFFQNY
jgi:hypothetical protein